MSEIGFVFVAQNKEKNSIPIKGQFFFFFGRVQWTLSKSTWEKNDADK